MVPPKKPGKIDFSALAVADSKKSSESVGSEGSESRAERIERVLKTITDYVEESSLTLPSDVNFSENVKGCFESLYGLLGREIPDDSDLRKPEEYVGVVEKAVWLSSSTVYEYTLGYMRQILFAIIEFAVYGGIPILTQEVETEKALFVLISKFGDRRGRMFLDVSYVGRLLC